MVQYSSIFTLHEEMQNAGFSTEMPYLEKTTTHTDDQILAELNKLLGCIETLDDYEQLIDIIDNSRRIFSMRFLYLFFQALVAVEMRIWRSAGMDIPMDKIMDEHIDLLLDKYESFAYLLEKDIVAWTKENGFFDRSDTYEFIKRRNSIYAKYITIAGEIMG